jgi:hypothetical protein
VTVAFHDPLQYVADPLGAPPLTLGALVVDDCGRFMATSILRPFNGFIAVEVKDSDADYVPTIVVIAVGEGEKVEDLAVFATRTSTDAGWTTTAGDPFAGVTFSAKGTYMAIFRHGGVPVEGVTITAGGVSQPGDAFYFSDPGRTRTTVDPGRTATGPNGTGLLTNSGLQMHSGMGGEPAGCEWPVDLAGAIAGVVYAQLRTATVSGDPETTCP